MSTVPPNGDLNPYGVAFVPEGFPEDGLLAPGDILVSNFNGSSGTQGTGVTILKITPDGQTSVFFQGNPGLGLTTALGVLRSGFVLVGNVPTQTTSVTTAVPPGSLLVIDRFGNLVSTLESRSRLDGPWDLAIHEEGARALVFVSNVLSGTVTRLDLLADEERGGPPTVRAETQIASGYAIRTDPAALVVGPTGLVFDARHDVLFVASTGDNTIFAIDQARETQNDNGTGRVAYRDDTHLHGPLALVMTPSGHLIAANGDAQNPDPSHPNFLVEFTAEGTFVSQFQLDPGGAGAAFGLGISGTEDGTRFAAVDDNANTLNIWDVPSDD
ncbi:MAG TPA: hypothetical protein VEV17_17520 [Bryobacteraceae bacterium]|nr:hypothetical protein [Bryobacteraceae bacterium]